MSIVIENLCKNFGTHAVLQNFNWTVDRPMVLMGASGCGKTTLLRILSGLETADSGTVTGVVTPAVVFQEDRLCPQLTAVDNLVLTGHGLTAAQARSDLQSLGFTKADLRLPAVQLSGGQKRRAAIAGVLAMRPEVLVLDEPAAGLDPEGREMILSQVKEYHKQTGATIVLVSHSMEDIAKYADRVLVLQGGEIAMLDTTANIFARADELLALGLSVPEVTKIFLRLRAKGVAIPTDVYTVKYGRDILLDALKRKGGGQHA